MCTCKYFCLKAWLSVGPTHDIFVGWALWCGLQGTPDNPELCHFPRALKVRRSPPFPGRRSPPPFSSRNRGLVIRPARPPLAGEAAHWPAYACLPTGFEEPQTEITLPSKHIMDQCPSCWLPFGNPYHFLPGYLCVVVTVVCCIVVVLPPPVQQQGVRSALVPRPHLHARTGS